MTAIQELDFRLADGTDVTLPVNASLASPSAVATGNLQSATPPAPHDQTTPGAHTAVIGAVVTASNRYLVLATLHCSGGANDVVTATLRSRAATVDFVYVSNATPCGPAGTTDANTFFATNDGPLGVAFSGSLTNADIDVQVGTAIDALNDHVSFAFAAVVTPNVANALATAKKVAFELDVQTSAGNATGITGTLSVQPLL